MSGAIGDISYGLSGVSHTTGQEYGAMPSKSAIQPAGGTITVHTNEVLSMNESADQITRFVQAGRQSSYSPQSNRDFRSDAISQLEQALDNTDSLSDSDTAALKQAKMLLQNDAGLEIEANIARNILIPA